MVLKRYIVEVTPEQARRLSPEQLELATRISSGPTQLLIFRDRFVAYKIATLSGGTFRHGHVVDGEALQGGFADGLALGDHTLMLEQARPGA